MTRATDILNFLSFECSGRAKAVKAKSIADRFGLSLREVNATIRELRRSGHVIGSSKIPPYGYYIPSTIDERREYLKCFKDELFDMLETYNRQKRAVFYNAQEQLALF